MNECIYHRAFGVYGIIQEGQALVVIKKNDGPYRNRYDLPGGILKDGEPLSKAILREIEEETGLRVFNLNQIGITSFRYPWKYQQYRFNQHIAVFYDIVKHSGEITATVQQFDGQDSLGAVMLPKIKLTNSSPLVLKARDYCVNGKVFASNDSTLDSWEVLTAPVF